MFEAQGDNFVLDSTLRELEASCGPRAPRLLLPPISTHEVGANYRRR